ncbi:hypothetical protein H0H87_006001 [Tephrocybe sp. NHM501043]|nr:hypothetical protein H0H87_006001 [Tephrocybe sp. NHM501043]
MSCHKFSRISRPTAAAYRQIPYQVRRWMAPDPRWAPTPYYPAYDCYWSQPPAIPPAIPRYHNIQPIYPEPKYDLYDPPTRKKLPRFEFPPQPQPPSKVQPQSTYWAQPPPIYGISPAPLYCAPAISQMPLHKPGTAGRQLRPIVAQTERKPRAPAIPQASLDKPDTTGLQIHPILAQSRTASHAPHLFWKLYEDPVSKAAWNNDAIMPGHPGIHQFLQEAAFPNLDVTSVLISYKHNNLGPVGKKDSTLLLKPRQPNRQITIQDVLYGIHDHLMEAIDHDDFVEATRSEIRDTATLMKARRTPGPAFQETCRKVDTLGGLVRFGGLRVKETKEGVLTLSLDLIPLDAV